MGLYLFPPEDYIPRVTSIRLYAQTYDHVSPPPCRISPDGGGGSCKWWYVMMGVVGVHGGGGAWWWGCMVVGWGCLRADCVHCRIIGG